MEHSGALGQTPRVSDGGAGGWHDGLSTVPPSSVFSNEQSCQSASSVPRLYRGPLGVRQAVSPSDRCAHPGAQRPGHAVRSRRRGGPRQDYRGRTHHSSVVSRPASIAVVVCTPRTLGGQWSDELAGKLRLRKQLNENLLRVVDHSELSELLAEPPDLLVLDEAHQMMQASDQRRRRDGLTPKSRAGVPSLLLLTATPLRGNADTFLGLLHLIDTEAYSLDEIEDFRRRLELRHEQASSIELLSPATPEVGGAGGAR